MHQGSLNASSVILEDPGGKFNAVLPTDRLGNNITWYLPPQIGTGYFTCTYFPSGLSLTVSRCRLKNSLHARLQASTDDCTLVFSLEGSSVFKNAFFRKGIEMGAGSNYLYWFPDPKLTREAAGGELLATVVLTFPKDRLTRSDIIQNASKRASGGGVSDLHSRQSAFCFQKDVNSRPIGTVLRQILHCPFQGQARRFFLEAKALELMALKVDMISGKPATPEKMNAVQMQGVLAARELLLKDLQNPPSIHALARAAGMSHPRLGTYFKSVFGF